MHQRTYCVMLHSMGDGALTSLTRGEVILILTCFLHFQHFRSTEVRAVLVLQVVLHSSIIRDRLGSVNNGFSRTAKQCRSLPLLPYEKLPSANTKVSWLRSKVMAIIQVKAFILGKPRTILDEDF